MKSIVLFVCTFFVATTYAATPVRLCGRTAVVDEGHIANGKFHSDWRWDSSKAKGLPSTIAKQLNQLDDCKASLDGKQMLVSSSHNAIAVVNYPAGDAVFYATVPNAHSIELLPNGIVAAASSTHPKGNQLMLFNLSTPNKPIFTMPLEAAHGVTWDPARNVLWVLGDDRLLQLSVSRKDAASVDVKVLNTYQWGKKGGHDLVLSHDGRSLVITTGTKVMLFDIASGTFSDYAPLSGMSGIKSISFEPGTERMAYTHADTGGWWTSTLHIKADGNDEAIPLDRETYKVRWAVR